MQNCKQFNQHANDLVELSPNENVTIYNHVNKTWEPGKILEKHATPRSYVVENSQGNVVRRNRVDLRKSVNKYERASEMLDGIPESEVSNEPISSQFDNNVVKTRLTSSQLDNNVVKTRSGRYEKKPQKLNL